MNGNEHDRVVGGPSVGDGHASDEDRRLVENLLEFVLVAIEILHRPGGAAEIVGDEVVGRDRRGAVDQRETGGGIRFVQST